MQSLAEEAQSHAASIEEIVPDVREETADTIEHTNFVDDRTTSLKESISETVCDLDAIASSAVETPEHVDSIAETTQTYAVAIEALASRVIGAISQFEELNERLAGSKEESRSSPHHMGSYLG